MTIDSIKLFVVNTVLFLLKCVLNITYFFLPSILVFLLLTSPNLSFEKGISQPKIATKDKVHDILPNTSWGHLRPCGEYFQEQEEFNKGRSCVNEKVWQKSQLKKDLVIPRCFIVSANSPDIYSDPSGTFNFIAIPTPLGIAAVVGVYEPETKTVFVVENVDAAEVYRHEIQHYFLHIHDPETQGGGHDQNIWKQCAPPKYTPSAKAKAISALRNQD